MLLDSAFGVTDACPDTVPDTSTAVDDTAVDDDRSDTAVDDTVNDTSDTVDNTAGDDNAGDDTAVDDTNDDRLDASTRSRRRLFVGGPIILCILVLIVDQLNCAMFILE